MRKTTIYSNLIRKLGYASWCIAMSCLGTLFAQTVIVGTSSATSTTGTNGSPIYRSSNSSTFNYSKSVELYTATDLTAAALPSAAVINSIAFDKKDGATVSGSNQFKLKIYLKNSSASALASGTSWDTMLSGATLFYDGVVDVTNNFPSAAGWVTLTNNTGNSFMYSGGSLEVFVDWAIQGTGTTPYTSAGFTWGYDTSTANQALGTSSSAVIPGTNTSYTVQQRRYSLQMDYTPAPACSGTPSAGTVNPTLAGCAGQSLSLVATGASSGQSGLTYQWESSPAGANTWTPIAGAITPNSTIPSAPTVATDYHLVVTCANSSQTVTSGTIAYTPNPATMCYCAPTTSGGTTYGIGNFTTSGASVNVANTSTGSVGYQDFTSSVAPIQVGQSTSFDYSIATLGTGTFGYAMWIDYDQNGTFEPTEQVLTTNSYFAGPKTGVVTVPTTATLGQTRLRILASFTPSNPSNPCLNSGTGEYEDYAITILPPPSCLPPTALIASNITVNSADVSWTASTTVPADGYDYYYSTSSTAPTAATAPSGSVGAGVLTVALSGLTSNTNYYVWVRSKCSSSDLSAWSLGTSFKTLCSIFTVPYTENFDTTATGSSTNNTVPSCWSYLEDSGYAGYGYVMASSTAHSTPNQYYLYNAAATTGNAMLVSPPTTNLSDGTKRVRFYAKGGTNYVLEVGTMTTPTDASTYTIIGSPIVLTSAWTLYTVDIPAGTNQHVVFKHGQAATYQSIYLDDILVENIPTCLEPTNVTFSNVLANTADVNWVASTSNPAGGYEYYYSTSSTVPTATTTPSGSVAAGVLTASLSGLTQNTQYYVWVRSVCTSSDKSAWSQTANFKTACDATTTMTENFDSYATGSIVPDCWARIVPASAPGSQTITSTTPASGTRNIYQYASSTQSSVIVVLPVFSNVNADTHRIRFKARVSSGAPGTLSVGYVTDVADASTFVSLQDLSITNTTYTDPAAEYTVDIPSSVPSNARIAIVNKNDAKSYYWDDVYWESKTPMAVSEIGAKDQVKVYPNPFSDELQISDITKVKSIKVTDIAGRVVKSFVKPSQKLTLSELKSGMYLVVLQMQDGTQQTVKAIKK